MRYKLSDGEEVVMRVRHADLTANRDRGGMQLCLKGMIVGVSRDSGNLRALFLPPGCAAALERAGIVRHVSTLGTWYKIPMHLKWWRVRKTTARNFELTPLPASAVPTDLQALASSSEAC